MVIFVVLFRLAMMPRYLQSYLNMGYHKLEELKQEAGKISNIDIQKLIARVFYYLCVVTLQYVTPMVMVLFLSLMYKTMGGGSWTGFWSDPSSVTGTPTPNPKISLEVVPNDIKIDKVFGQEEDVEALSSQFSLAWHSLKHVSLHSVEITESQCGIYRIFLSLKFYVKSNLTKLESQNLSF